MLAVRIREVGQGKGYRVSSVKTGYKAVVYCSDYTQIRYMAVK